MPQLVAFALLTTLGSMLCVAAVAAEPLTERPWASSALNIESGMLWQIGSATPFEYKLVPTLLSWRSGDFIQHAFPGGSWIVVRHRLTLIGTFIQNGPESRYFAIAGSPSVEWWDRTGRWSLFAGVGGGFGLIDSREISGGQGQNFTLNSFLRAGIEHVTAGHTRWSAGLMFQHMSNGGMTNPNPGIDALGVMLGISRSY